jgi:hypothetical protein
MGKFMWESAMANEFICQRYVLWPCETTKQIALESLFSLLLPACSLVGSHLGKNQTGHPRPRGGACRAVACVPWPAGCMGLGPERQFCAADPVHREGR